MEGCTNEEGSDARAALPDPGSQSTAAETERELPGTPCEAEDVHHESQATRAESLVRSPPSETEQNESGAHPASVPQTQPVVDASTGQTASRASSHHVAENNSLAPRDEHVQAQCFLCIPMPIFNPLVDISDHICDECFDKYQQRERQSPSGGASDPNPALRQHQGPSTSIARTLRVMTSSASNEPILLFQSRSTAPHTPSPSWPNDRPSPTHSAPETTSPPPSYAQSNQRLFTTMRPSSTSLPTAHLEQHMPANTPNSSPPPLHNDLSPPPPPYASPFLHIEDPEVDHGAFDLDNSPSSHPITALATSYHTTSPFPSPQSSVAAQHLDPLTTQCGYYDHHIHPS